MCYSGMLSGPFEEVYRADIHETHFHYMPAHIFQGTYTTLQTQSECKYFNRQCAVACATPNASQFYMHKNQPTSEQKTELIVSNIDYILLLQVLIA